VSMTPLHPLMAKVGPLTRDELLEVVRYEGLIGLSDDDAVAAIHLTAEGLIEITMLHGQPRGARPRRRARAHHGSAQGQRVGDPVAHDGRGRPCEALRGRGLEAIVTDSALSERAIHAA
jgi:hypothetical protein